MSEPCAVYIAGVAANGLIVGPWKVGISSNPEARVKALQTGNHEEVALASEFWVDSIRTARLIEAKAHALLYGEHVTGEWFTGSVVDIVCSLFAASWGVFRETMRDEEAAEAQAAMGLNAALVRSFLARGQGGIPQ